MVAHGIFAVYSRHRSIEVKQAHEAAVAAAIEITLAKIDAEPTTHELPRFWLQGIPAAASDEGSSWGAGTRQRLDVAGALGLDHELDKTRSGPPSPVHGCKFNCAEFRKWKW